jgi:hypothetical protein
MIDELHPTEQPLLIVVDFTNDVIERRLGMGISAPTVRLTWNALGGSEFEIRAWYVCSARHIDYD